MVAYLKKLASDVTRPIALFVSLFFALAFSAKCYQHPDFLFFILAFRYWAMSIFISNRLPAENPVPLHQRAVAYGSKAIPYLYQAAPSGVVLGYLGSVAGGLEIVGTLLSTAALFSLGRRFGVAPAKRGEVCRSGLYRWFRHPIYLGYALVEIGCVLVNPQNAPLFLLSMGTLLVRARMEDKVLRQG